MRGEKIEKITVFLESILKQSTPSQPVWNQEAILEKNQLLGAA